MPTNIYAEFERAAGAWPEKIALEMFRDEGDLRYTYRQTLDYAERVGAALRARGVKQGECVAFWARLSPNWVAAYFGALRSGIVIAPLDVEYERKDLDAVLAQVACRAIFTMEEKLPLLRELLAGRAEAPLLVALDADEDPPGAVSIRRFFETADAPPPPAEVGPEDVAMLFFTSGTTGRPKGVVIPHRSITTTLGGIIQYLRVSPADKVLAVIPPHHIFASLANILMPLIQGGGVTYPRAINSVELMKTMEKGGITVFPAVPQVFYLLHRKIFEQINSRPLPVRLLIGLLLRLSRGVRQLTGLNPGPTLFSQVHRIFGGRLRLLVSAASYFDPRIIRDFTGLGFTVQQGYALTETFGSGTFTPFFDNVVGSAGRPLPGVELRIVDPDEHGVGEIAIAGPCLMTGYLNDPAATAEVMRNGWFHTGDLATQGERGNVYIRGRRKEMIVLSSGKKIYPEEIEQHYLQFPYIKEMCVMGAAGGDEYAQSERLHAVIVPDFEYMKQHRVVNAKEVVREGIEEYSAYLPRHKRILSYEIQTEPLPRTTSRKLIRSKVVSHALQPQAGDADEAAGSLYRSQPGDDLLEAKETSQRALAILRRESRLDRDLHLDMNLELDLGFDSLQRIEVLMQLEQALGVPLGDDVSNQTLIVRDLLRTINERLAAGGARVSAAAPARITWKEIVAAAAADDLAAKYILEPSPLSRTLHFLVLRFIYLLGRIFFRLRVRGLENLPRERPFMICPNHEGYLDGPLVSAALPYRVIRHLFTLGFTPFFYGGFRDWIARNARVVPVDADTNLGRAMKISAIGLKARQNLLIFPEGGLSCDGELQTFKKGVGILAKELSIPIVPTAIEGSFEAWSKVGKGVKLFAPVTITFGAPIEIAPPESGEAPAAEDPDREYTRIARQIRDAIRLLLQQEQEAAKTRR